MSQKQKTIAREVVISGIGLHTGKQVSMTFKPAPVDNGYTFVRADLEGRPVVEADANLVCSTSRGTTLEKRGVKVFTTEHTLAAVSGCDIDNIIIEMDGPEPPIMDGSSKYFIEALESAGIVEQEADRNVYVVKDVISYSDPATGSEITVIPADEFQVTTMVDFGTKVLGTQNAGIKNISEFKSEIGSCRTFCFLHELEQLINNGLIKGGDLTNAIVYVDKEISEETMNHLKRIFHRDKVTVKPNGRTGQPHPALPQRSRAPQTAGRYGRSGTCRTPYTGKDNSKQTGPLHKYPIRKKTIENNPHRRTKPSA